MQTHQSTPTSTKPKSTQSPEVSAYKGYIVVDRVTSADLVDPVTFQWISCPSARSARWTAAVFSRVHREFASHTSYNHSASNDFTLLFKVGQVLETALSQREHEQRNTASKEVH